MAMSNPRPTPGPSLADREGDWAAALLCGDAEAMGRIARRPLPVDTPDDARTRWAARREALAAAGVPA